MLLLREVADLIQSTPRSDASGAKCHFYEVGGIGIKTWTRRDIAEDCFEKQIKIAELGFAPKVYGDLFEAENHHGDIVWCYQTELAAVIGSALPKWDDGDFEEMESCIECANDMVYASNREMGKIGWTDDDDHRYNWGIMPDGKIVCIDFDHVRETHEWT
jgi:hypothetical protein